MPTAGVPAIRIAQDAADDGLLGRGPLALLLGVLFDQHVPRGCGDPLSSGRGRRPCPRAVDQRRAVLDLVEPDVRLQTAWLDAHVEWGPGQHEDGFGLGPEDEVGTPAGFARWVAALVGSDG